MNREAPDYGRISGAIRRLSQAASGYLGADCYLHAAFAARLLARQGVAAKVVVGHAAWRVGDGDADVVLHAPAPNFPPQPGILFHAWVLVDGVKLFDPTTYQLRQKAAALDAIDGQKTTVAWCPDYLLADVSRVSTLFDVIQKTQGLFFYKRVQELEERVLAEAQALDPEDVAMLELVYENPEATVVGPNHFEKS